MTRAVNWQTLRIRIAWSRCNRRQWPPTRELPFTPEQRRKRRNVLLYFWAGEGRRRLPEGEVAVTAGACHWSRPGWSYSCRQAPDKPLGITAIHFDLLDAAGQVIPPQECGLPGEVLTIRYPRLVDEVTAHIAHLSMRMRAGSALARPEQDSAAEMLHGILVLLDGDSRGPEAAGRAGQALWPEVTRHLHEHLQAPPSLAELARHWGYTRSHFSRLFAARFGVPPHRYILNARIALAKELLRETEIPIAQVAELAGFANAAQFARRFRLGAGVTASAYRAREDGRPSAPGPGPGFAPALTV